MVSSYVCAFEQEMTTKYFEKKNVDITKSRFSGCKGEAEGSAKTFQWIQEQHGRR